MKTVFEQSRRWGALVGVAVLAGCATPQVASGISDPYEARNRLVYEENRLIDEALVRDAASAYGDLPEPVRIGFSNFGQFMSLPHTIANDLLQFNLADAVHNTMRLAVNASFGLGGLLDPATEMGLGERPSDFGITLAVWGVPEGNYVVHPILGPTTERDTFGMIGDRLVDPLGYIGFGRYAIAITATSIANALGDRNAFADTVDALLYGSADGYAQARLIFLENRRFEVGGRSSESTYFDPYEDLYEDPDAQ